MDVWILNLIECVSTGCYFMRPPSTHPAIPPSSRMEPRVWVVQRGALARQRLITNDIVNESSHWINELKRIESRKVLEKLWSQSGKWRRERVTLWRGTILMSTISKAERATPVLGSDWELSLIVGVEGCCPLFLRRNDPTKLFEFSL